MEQFDLFEDFQKQNSVSIFNDRQTIALQNLGDKTPKIVKFLTADKFDDKFINSTNNIWTFYYSGQKEKIDFSRFSENETSLVKFFLIIFIQRNSPSFLSRKFYSINFLINHLKKNNLDFSYENLKKFLIEIAPLENHCSTYGHVKFLLKLLIVEEFPKFNIEDDFELEFIPRPQGFNAHLFYQEYQDSIDYALISMIQQGLTKLNQAIHKTDQNISQKTLLNSAILGLVYVTGLRPVQLARLATEDIKIDTARMIDQFHRYSILIPYAKQSRYVHEKISVKLPEEVAEIIIAYIERFNLSPKDKLFDLGENSARFCSKAINTQLFEFSPESYKEAVLVGEMIKQKYSFSDFRHHVGYSLAMAGSSAEEIAYILGHSSVVTARHYIFSTPELAQIRAQALGKNSLYRQMIAMLLTGRLIYKKDWHQKKVLGNIGSKIHYDIGGCSYEDKCLFQPVRNCYGCMYFHPFIDANHNHVLESIQNEINDLIKLSDGIGVSRNPLIRVHESTKFEIESVIARCALQKDDIYEQ